MQKYCELKNIHYFCIIFHVSITLNYKNAGIQTPITQIFKISFFYKHETILFKGLTFSLNNHICTT